MANTNRDNVTQTEPFGRITVLVLGFDGMTLVDVVGPFDVLDVTTRYVLGPGGAGYDVTLASHDDGLVRASNGLAIETMRLDGLTATFDTVVVPGGGPPDNPPIPPEIVSWLVSNAARFRRVCAVCTGTFLLGEAGLITGRRVTTHWQAADLLKLRFPKSLVDSEPVFVRDGNIWTSAGFSAGSDLALALVEQDFGHATAIESARRLVVFLKRTGDLPQISIPLEIQASSDETFSRLHAWITANLSDDLSVEALADYVGMSPRTFSRTYAERLGRTPGKTVETIRMEAAFRLLVTTSHSLKWIAVKTGFGTEQTLRRAFIKAYDQTPTEIRSRHRDTGALSGTHRQHPNPTANPSMVPKIVEPMTAGGAQGNSSGRCEKGTTKLADSFATSRE